MKIVVVLMCMCSYDVWAHHLWPTLSYSVILLKIYSIALNSQYSAIQPYSLFSTCGNRICRSLRVLVKLPSDAGLKQNYRLYNFHIW